MSRPCGTCPLDAPTGGFQLNVRGIWLGAKDPCAWQTPLQATTDNAGLIAPSALVDSALDGGPPPRAAG